LVLIATHAVKISIINLPSTPMKTPPYLITLTLAMVCVSRAELKLPAIIADHMVLQQKQANPI